MRITPLWVAAALAAGCSSPPPDVPLALRVVRGDADPLSDPGASDRSASAVDRIELTLTGDGETKSQQVAVTGRTAQLRLEVEPPFEGKLLLKALRAADGVPWSVGRANAVSIPQSGETELAVFVGPLDAFTPVGEPIAGPRLLPAVAALGQRGALIVGGHPAADDATSVSEPALLLYDHARGRTCGAQDGCLSGEQPLPRRGAVAARLTDGSVLHGLGKLGDGTLDTALYLTRADGSTSKLAAAGPARSNATLLALADGSALLFGGSDAAGPTTGVHRVDVKAGTVTAQPPMLTARASAGAVLLSTGQIFLAGGEGTAGALASAEVYTVGQGSALLDGGAFAQARKTMRGARASPRVARLGDDSVLIFGGGVPPEVFRLELGALVGGLVDLVPPPADKSPQSPALIRVGARDMLLVGGEASGSLSPIALRFTPTPNQVLGPQSATYQGTYRVIGAAASLRAAPDLAELSDGAVLLVGGGTLGDVAAGSANPPAPRVEVLVPGPAE